MPKQNIHFINKIFFHQIFVLSEMWTHLSKHVAKFSPPKFELFDQKNTKIATLQFSFLVHYAQPKLNQRSPKDPKFFLILTMKQVYTHFQYFGLPCLGCQKLSFL